MQGKEKNIIQFGDLINAFVVKLSNWKRKVQKGNLAMFSNLADISELDEALKTDVPQYLENLESEFKSYFPEAIGDDLFLARNPFRLSPEKVEDELQDQLTDLKNDSNFRDLFESLPVTEFWLSVALSYPQISTIAL